VCNTPIPCFRDVICSVKTDYKVETHTAKSMAACMQFYLSDMLAWPTVHAICL